MKRLLLGFFLLAFCGVFGQNVPQGINYQAVARDNTGAEIINTSITARFSIGPSSVSNSSFNYQETHSINTNQFGLFNVAIGQGTPSGSSPAFSSIGWSTPQYLLVEVDFGSGFEQMGVATPFVTVPYAFLAKDVLNKELPTSANSNDILVWNGSAWVAQAPGSVAETTTTLVDNADGTFTYTNEIGAIVTFDANINDGDSDATNEIQDLQLVGNTLSITNNGSSTPIDLSIYDELPTSATTGQVLTWNGTNWVAQNPGSGADNWGSQTVVSDGTLTGDGTSGSPLSGFDGDYNNLSNQPTIPTATSQLTNDSGFLTTEVDGSTTNEIQDLNISGNNLNISGGGTGTPISSTPPSSVGQVLTWNGSSWVAQNPGSGADNWGSQTVVSDGTLTGDGTSGSPLSGFDGDYNNLSNQPTIPTTTSQLTNDSGFLTTEVDGSTTNEIQDLNISGNSLNISGGGTGTPISSTPPTLSGQVLTWNGTSWEAIAPVVGTDTDDQTIDVFQLSGNNLELSLEDDAVPTQSVDLSSFMDNTDNQTLTLTSAGATNTISISNGNNVSFSVNDADADVTNELNTGFGVSGSDLVITDGGGSLSVPLSSLAATDSDWTESTTSVYNDTKNIGIGTSTPNASTMLHVESNSTPSVLIKESTPTAGAVLLLESQKQWMVHSNESGDFKITDNTINRERVIIDGANGNMSLGNVAGGAGSLVPSGKTLSIATANTYTTTSPATLELIGTSAAGADFMGRLAYGYVLNTSTSNYIGGIDMDKIGNMMFNTNATESMRISSSGNVGIGTTSPTTKLDIESNSFNLLSLTTTGANSNVNVEINTTGAGAAQFRLNGGTGGYSFLTTGNGTTPVMTLRDNGRVGINSTLAPLSALDVSGQITMRTGATAGYIPVSDANGTMTWTDPSTLPGANDGDWTKGGSYVYNTTENIGIGTSSPSAKLEILTTTSLGQAVFRILNSTSTNIFNVKDNGWVGINTSTAIGDANFVINDADNSGYGGMYVNSNDNTTGKPFYGYSVNNSALAWSYVDVADANKLKFYVSGDRMTISQAGNVGIGTTTPGFPLTVETSTADRGAYVINNNVSSSTQLGIYGSANGTGSGQKRGGSFEAYNGTGSNMGVRGYASGSTSSNYGVYGMTGGSGALTNYGLYASASGATNNWAGYFASGNVYVTNDMGVGVSPTKKLHVVNVPSGTYDAAIYASNTNSNNSGFFGAMVYDGGTTNYGVFAHSDALGNTSPLGVNRAADGLLVSFMSGGVQEGTISVSGTTVAYGAFTGVHYAISEENDLDKGLLVTLNGKNDHINHDTESEILHGISISATPNDPSILGAYLGLLDVHNDHSNENPHQVMSVGNGVMWVIDNGSDLKPGDYLISSNIAGHAMLDKGEYDISNVIARVSEPVNWSEETMMIGGIKHKRVAVFFENFVINHKANQLDKELELLKSKYESLESEIELINQKIGIGSSSSKND